MMSPLLLMPLKSIGTAEDKGVAVDPGAENV